MAYDGLEDEFGDVIAKARRGQERTIADVAAAIGMAAADLQSLEAYESVPEAAVVDALAGTLGLDAEKLRRSAAGDYFPAQPEGGPVGGVELCMRVLGTDFLMNGYAAICARTRRAAVIDPGFQPERLLEAVRAADAEVETVWITHGHGDHVGAVADVVQATGATAYIHEPDLELTGLHELAIDGRLRPGETVTVGEQAFEVRATPGHTAGGVSFVHAAGLAFCGDALFAGSLGGTRRVADYEGQRRAVAEQLLSLPPETILCPGHGPATTVGEERAHNPFFDL